MINEAANTFDRFRLSTINMIGWCIFLTRFYLFTWVTLIINSTVLNFYFCTLVQIGLFWKMKAKQLTPLGDVWIFSVRKTFPQRSFLSQKYFFFLITCLHVHLPSICTLINSSITGKVTSSILLSDWLMATDIIFDRITEEKHRKLSDYLNRI